MNKRLPTIYEWQELIDNCTWEWSDELKGMKVTGKNGKSIFLSANGFRRGTDLYGVGSYGFYWSSSLNTGHPSYAWYVGFVSDNALSYDGNRNFCLSIRPVSTTQQEGFIDLGLPSGLLWAEKNIGGYYTYDEAMKLFEDEGIEANDSALKGGSYTIPEGFESEFKEWHYTIPEGYEAEIKDGKIIVKEKESEDEKIRKHIIDIIRENAGLKSIPCDVEIAWLEKMKEQKPYEPKNWPADKDNLTQEQKPAEWSEEDEKKLEHIIELIHISSASDVSIDEKEELENFLKSLRPQSHTVSIKDAIKFGNLEYERGVKDGIQNSLKI